MKMRKYLPVPVLLLAMAALPAQAQSYTETFEAGTGATSAALATYGGAAAPYTASNWWLNYAQCNGVIIRYLTPTFQAGHCDGDFSTNNDVAKNNVRRMADVLGQIAASNGPLPGDSTNASFPTNRSTAASQLNHALTAWTINNGSTAFNNQVQFETGLIPGLNTTQSRYYTARIDIAEASCTFNSGLSNSRLYFSLVSGVETFINTASNPIRVCTNPSARYYTSPVAADMPATPAPSPWFNGGVSVRAGRFYSPGAIKVPAGGSGVRFRMYNAIGDSQGNDAAVDNISLVDATPGFSKSFSPSTVATGGSTVLTFTVTNTADNLAKPGWEFTDNLAAGLTLANTTVGGTCRNFADSGTPADLVGSAGASSFTIRGSLPAGASCTVTVNIQVGANVVTPNLQNCGSNISSPIFILPPTACATLDVTRPVTLTKIWQNAIAGNAVSLTISGADVSGATAGSSTAPSTTAAANAQALLGSTVTVTEAFTSGNPTGYATTLACTKASDGSAVAVGPSGLSGTFTMPSDSGVNCVFTNQKIATLTLRKQWVNAVVGDDATVTVSRGATVLDTLVSDAGSANELDTDATPVTVNAGDTLTLAETLAGTNTGLYNGTLACTGTSGLSGTTLAVGSADSAIVCTYTNTRRQASLSIAKSNSASTLVAGSSTTYTITVTNNGPDAATGAVVTDPASGRAGLTCPTTNTVTCSSGTAGACSTPTTTVGALTSPGYTLGTLPANTAATLSFVCTVN